MDWLKGNFTGKPHVLHGKIMEICGVSGPDFPSKTTCHETSNQALAGYVPGIGLSPDDAGRRSGI